MKYHLNRSQQLNCTIETAWEFFSSPYNLAKITPKELGFDVLTSLDKDADIYPGMIIEYRVSPLLGIPLRWKTCITEVVPFHSFTDFQEKGPYKLWNHHHTFEPNEDGVLMTDHLTYALPFGLLGRFVHSLVVRRKVEEIFNYRHRVLEEKFNGGKHV